MLNTTSAGAGCNPPGNPLTTLYMGRPTKLTKKTCDLLFSFIEKGYSLTDSCAAARVHYDTMNEWRKAGEAATSGPYYEFSERLKEAKAKANMRAVDGIEKAAESDWKAHAWLLERRDPENWGKKETASVDVNHSGSLEIVFKDVEVKE